MRLPDEILTDLRKIAAAKELAGEKRPKFGDVLLDAWRIYKRNLFENRAIIIEEKVPVPVPGQTPQSKSGKFPSNVLQNTSAEVEIPLIRK